MRILFTVGLVILLAGAGTAGEIYVPDNSASTGSTIDIPFLASSMKTKGRYQAFYDKKYLGTSKFIIDDIAFAPNWSGKFEATVFEVRIANFAGSSLSTVDMNSNIPNSVLVLQETTKMTWTTTEDTWCPLGLTSKTFQWDGKSNIVVDIRYSGGTTTDAMTGHCRYDPGTIPCTWAVDNPGANSNPNGTPAKGLKTKFTTSPPLPEEGWIVGTNFRDPSILGSYGPGTIFGVDPNTGTMYTISASFALIGTTRIGPNCIEMASDNTHFIVGSLPGGATPTAIGNGIYVHMVNSRTGAAMSTLIADTTTGIGYVNAFDLDGDGMWILGGGTRVFSYNENTMSYQTLFTSSAGTVNALTLDPALPAGDIVIGNFATGATTPKLIAATRSGILSTMSIAGPTYISGVRRELQTGDYLASAFGPNLNGTGGEFSRISKAGVYTSLNDNVTSMYRANGLYLRKDRTAWVLTYDWRTTPIPTISGQYVCSIYKVDYQGVFITQYVYSSTLIRDRFAPSGITEYGSRQVVCNGSGRPGTTVNVRFSSRKLLDAGKRYQLAAAFSYTNGIKFANGEVLDLTFDTLLFLSANNLLPTMFQNFSGHLDQNGNAQAAVKIPSWTPPGLGVPVFVSGIVIDPGAPGGVTTVGNTHWFTLN
jgi:hypothetical protein